jgi:hypothetical protein
MIIRVLSVLASTCLAGATLLAADASFAGKWKLNTDKSKFSGLEEKIENLGGDKYKFSFGDDTETIVLDGKDYPTKYGNMWSVTKTGPNSWKSVEKRDNKVTSTSLWTLSEDAQTFTSTTDGTRPDGSTYQNVFKAKRTAGTSGLAGTWESTELKLSSPAAWEIAAWQGDGLSFITPAEKERLDLKFDGKDYPDKGPRVAEGTTASGKRIDARTIEVSGKLKGKPLYTQRLELSADGKTLTATMSFPGVAKPEIDVYERQ